MVKSEDHSALLRTARDRLAVARSRLVAADERVEQLLNQDVGISWNHFEAAQAQLHIYVRRADRLIAALYRTSPGATSRLERDLSATWDDIAIALHRLSSRLTEISQVEAKKRRR